MKEIGLWDKWCLETVLDDVRQGTLIGDGPMETLIEDVEVENSSIVMRW